MLLENLAITAGMIVLCVVLHGGGLYALMRLLQSERARPLREGQFHMRGATVIGTVFGLLALHAIQIGAYAALYLQVGQFDDFETALYFSGTTFSTLGYGDITITATHRLLAAGEGVIGLILIGWSTAILVAVTTRLLGQNGPITGEPGAPAPQTRDSP